MSECEIERTKYWIKQFILANKLRVKANIPREEYDWLRTTWTPESRMGEYRKLWGEVEKEITNE